MMTPEIANSWWMYLLGGIVCLFVLIGSGVFIFKACRDTKHMGMDLQYLRRTAIISALFTILPSVSILIGVIALSGVIGVPLPWIRLSVIGALHYEGAAINAVYTGTMAAMTMKQFVTIATVMTLGILTGPLYCLFGFKSYDRRVLSKAKQTDENKKSFGPILFNAAFIAMICAFLAEDLAKLVYVGAESPMDSYVPAIVIGISFISMALLDLLVKKTNWKWISSFSLGISMLLGMAGAMIFA